MKIEDVVWKIKVAGHFDKDEVWLDQLARLRGEIFYDEGNRPAFLNSSGECYDRDEFEMLSTHILAYEGKKLIGAIRLLPLRESSYRCVSSTIVGHEHFKAIIQELFPYNSKIAELNRFVVHRDYQDMRLGVYLCAAIFVLADNLNYLLIANANIHLLPLFYVKHLGGVLFPKHAGPYSSKYYNDNDIYFLYSDKERYSPFFIRQMHKIKRMIPFEQILAPMRTDIEALEEVI